MSLQIINGKFASINEVRFVHLRRPIIELQRLGVGMGKVASKGGITIAYQKLSDTQYKCAVARCRPNERYIKSKGREESLKILKMNDDVWNLDLSEDTDFYTELVETLTNVAQFRKNLSPVVVKRR